MKRAKQTERIIEAVNEYMRNNQIKDTADPVFIVMTHALMRAKVYHGYNYYTAEGRLSGGGDNTDHIQIY